MDLRTPVAQSQILRAAGRDNTYHNTRTHPTGQLPPRLVLSPHSPPPGPLHFGMSGASFCRQPAPTGATSQVHPCDVTPCFPDVTPRFPDVTPRLSARPSPKASLDAPLGAGGSSHRRWLYGSRRTVVPGSAFPLHVPEHSGYQRELREGSRGRRSPSRTPAQTRDPRQGRSGPRGTSRAPAETRPLCGIAGGFCVGNLRTRVATAPPHPGWGLRRGSVKRWKSASKPLRFLLL